MEDLRSQIESFIQSYGKKHFTVPFRKDENLKQKLLDATSDVPETLGLAQRAYMVMNPGEHPICRYRNTRRWKNLDEGFGYCGRASKCQCYREEVSEKTKQGIVGRTEQQQESINQKRNQTNLQRYGTENVSQNEQINKKRQSVMMERYGTHSALTNDDLKRQGMLNRYGVENPQQIETIRQKTETTNLQRYGGRYPAQSKEVREKAIETSRQRYGTDYPTQKHIPESSRPIIYDKDRFEEFIKEKTSYQAYSELGISQVFFNQLLVRYGLRNPGRSQFEYALRDFFDSLGVEYHTSDRTILYPNELDFVFPDHNLALEANGLFWHSERFGVDRKYHLEKTTRCEELGYRLIHLFEDEWNYKTDVVKRRLRSLLGKSTRGAPARKCSVKPIEPRMGREFLDQYHIQGSETTSPIHLGAYDGDVLVAVMTFGPRRMALGGSAEEGHYELVRFATDGDTHSGLASKMFKTFIRTYNPLNVITYADRRWSQGEVYTSMGFVHTGTSRPNYWYVGENYQRRFHRFGFRKSILVERYGGDPNLTEVENARNLGLDRIWDCGTLRFEWDGQD